MEPIDPLTYVADPASPTSLLAQGLFYTLGALALGGGVVIVLAKDLVRAVLALLVVLVAVAGIFFLLAAPVVGAAQLLVYAGGVMTLILFGLLTSRPAAPTEGTGPTPTRAGRRPLALPSPPGELFSSLGVAAAIGLGLYISLIDPIKKVTTVAPLGPTRDAMSLKGLGLTMVLQEPVALELSGVLLLVALTLSLVWAQDRPGRR